MARGRRNRGGNDAEDVIKLILVVFILIALGIGGITGFVSALGAIVSFALLAAVSLLAVFFLVRQVIRYVDVSVGREPYSPAPQSPASPAKPSLEDVDLLPQARARASLGGVPRTMEGPPSSDPRSAAPTAPTHPPISAPAPAPIVNPWTLAAIQAALGEIDWYQFEKFCAALLRSDGFNVERKGGAQPDGGVDLVVTTHSEDILVQCKHWKTWSVQEKVVREMLGSMAHFRVQRGAIYTLKGWTRPAALFAEEHHIDLQDSGALARRALAQLSADQLDVLLKPRQHHCPKCESLMILRSGDFEAFWGCSRFPRCRGKLYYSGAR